MKGMAPQKTNQAIDETTEWQIIILSPGDPRVEFPINEPITNIGRQQKNQVVLRDTTVSRVHAQILYDRKIIR